MPFALTMTGKTGQRLFPVTIGISARRDLASKTRMTADSSLHKMAGMQKLMSGAVLLMLLATATLALGQKDKDNEPTSWIYFNVVKEDNGKPVRNAAVIMHPVNANGKQGRGDMELKTSPEGKTDFDGVPYGMLRVQVIASGFQTYGEDFDISKEKTEITIKLKRPQGQFSIYDDHAKGNSPPAKQDPSPADPKDKKPN